MSGRRSISNTFTVTTMDNPVPGPRGKTGRFYYYAQEWSNNPNVSYAVTDAEAPYFLYNGNYWVFNPANNGTYTMAAMGTPSSSNENWELMVTDFKYLITEAIFGSYAHFGSFIINGDWMISQHGTINGSQSTSYTKFYPEFIHGCSICESFDVSVGYVIAGSAYFIGGKKYYIKVSGSSFSSGSQLNVRMYDGSSNVGETLNLTSSSSSGTITFESPTSGTYYLRADMNADSQTAKLTAYVDDCFIPNFAINGLTGETYQTSGTFTGTINAKLVYGAVKNLSTESTPYNVDPESEPYSSYYAPSGKSDARFIIELPDPDVYDGLELKFFSPGITRLSGGAYLHSSNGIYCTDNNGLLTSTSKVQLEMNQFVTVKAMLGAWYVVNGEVFIVNV